NERERFFDVIPYQKEILDNLRDSEKKYRPNSRYMRDQDYINYKDRSMLINWLVKMSKKHNLNTETLYLSVAYLDRYLSVMMVKKPNLRLVGTTALYIAAKYEETMDNFAFLTDNVFRKKHVMRKEKLMLKILSFNLFTPTAHCFINVYSALTGIANKLKYLALYISELSLMNAAPFMQHVPSLMSSASLALARHTLGLDMWTPELEVITTYKIRDMKAIIRKLSIVHNEAENHVGQAIRVKYTGRKFENVA
ncbi:hypothetical protein KR038_010764, partial [Drosophila bunnanda]